MCVSSLAISENILPADEPLISLDAAATQMNVPVSRVKQMLREHKMIAIKDGSELKLPEKYFDADGSLIKFVSGLITLLADGGYSDEEIVRHLYTEDPSLPGMPIDALRGHLAREVLRRAQAMAF